MNIIFDTTLLLYVAIGIFIILIGWMIRLEIRIKKLLSGSDGKSLESSISGALEDIKKIHDFQKEAVHYFENVEKRLSRSIQSVETVRFNPFKGTDEGGNQSFSTAFVNEKGSGVVISSLYSRDRVSIFSKPLQTFNSDFEMTDEEKNVVSEAKKNLATR